MKSSDERIDEELRKALRDRFDHFERLPDPTLRDKVFAGLAGKSAFQTGGIAALAVLIALTALVFLTSRPAAEETVVAAAEQVKENAPAAGVRSKVRASREAVAGGRVTAPSAEALPAQRSINDAVERRAAGSSPEALPAQPALGRPMESLPAQPSVNSTVVQQTPGRSTETLPAQPSVNSTVVQQTPGRSTETLPAQPSVNSTVVHQTPGRSAETRPAQPSVNSALAQQTAGRSTETLPAQPSVNSALAQQTPGRLTETLPAQPSANTTSAQPAAGRPSETHPAQHSAANEPQAAQPADAAILPAPQGANSIPQDRTAAPALDANVLEGLSVADQDIGVLDHRPLALPQYPWQPDSLVTPGEPRKRYEFLFKDRWSFIVSATPLRTFQILTVRPGNNGVVYQNFVLPAKISAETVGYKLSAGVERKGFQFALNYGQFKQSYRYEIATSEFVVGPNLSGQYDVVRKGIPQEENSTVRIIGLSAKKHMVRRSHFLRNYFGDVGAEFSRDLSSDKNMMWVNAGFGKELVAGKNVVMTVGPYIEYSLSKLRNPDNPFKIQAYQIGLSVGLKYSKK